MSGQPPSPECRACRFFEAWPSDDDRTDGEAGECRRKSPAVRIGRPDYRRGGQMSPDEAVWPPVFANEWCGDFQHGQGGAP